LPATHALTRFVRGVSCRYSRSKIPCYHSKLSGLLQLEPQTCSFHFMARPLVTCQSVMERRPMHSGTSVEPRPFLSIKEAYDCHPSTRPPVGLCKLSPRLGAVSTTSAGRHHCLDIAQSLGLCRLARAKCGEYGGGGLTDDPAPSLVVWFPPCTVEACMPTRVTRLAGRRYT
jgi:hypothetical protein